MTVQSIPRTNGEWQDMLEALDREESLGVDTEFSGPLKLGERGEYVDPLLCTLTGISLSTEGRTWYVPTGHREGNATYPWQRKLWDCLGARRGVTVAWNAKAELASLHRHGVDASGWRWACAQVGAFLAGMDSGNPKRPFALKPWALAHLRMLMLDFESVTGGRDFNQLDPTDVVGLQYACEDAEAARGAHGLIAPRLREWGLEGTFWDLEMPLCKLLVRMERHGVGVDTGKLGELRDTWLVEQRQLEREWAQHFPGIKLQGPTLQNFYALGDWPTQYDDGSKVERNDSGKGFSTERDVLERLQPMVDPDSWGGRAIGLKLRHSLLSKLTSTYTDSLVDIADHYPDGRLHVDIHQTQTRTGRLSCSYLQNLPTRSREGSLIRQAIRCAQGRRLIGVDYSQIEPRYLAHLLGRGALFDAYQNDEDAYVKMGERIKRDRGTAKKELLAIMYGIGIMKTARDLKCSVPEAKELLEDTKAGMPEIFEWKERVWAFARKHGYVRTLSGRRRYLRHINAPGRFGSEGASLRAQDERRATNTPIQGSARDVVALAMLKVDALGLPTLDPCLQIHDEMLYEVDPRHAAEAKAEIQRAFESAVQLKVPLKAEPEVGDTWASVK